ncbi:MAG: hypothetical protein ACYDBJ_14135 [Aggregatilineales bacterium]
MSSLVFLIEQIANGLYLLCGVGVLLGLRALFSARRELSVAEFELERGLAMRRQSGAVTWTLIVIEVALGVYAVKTVVAPAVRSDLNVPGQAVSIAPFQTPVAGAQGTPIDANALDAPLLTLTALPAGGPGLALGLTATPAPTLPGTIVAGAPPPVGCTNADAFLQVPANGQVLFESVTVIGTAKTANFAHYKFELSGPSTGNTFAPYGGDKQTQVTTTGVLGQLSLTPFSPGTYLFRLTVFDSTNQLKASCMVTVSIQPRPPTATPSQTPPPVATK